MCCIVLTFSAYVLQKKIVEEIFYSFTMVRKKEKNKTTYQQTKNYYCDMKGRVCAVYTEIHH